MKMQYTRIPWIFFDLDDTLWNFTENSKIALHELYRLSPILRKLFKSEQEYIDIYHAHNSKLWLMYARGEVTTRELKIERWRRTLATKQFEVLTAVCEELDRTYLDILARSSAEMEGSKEILHELTKKVLVGVLSNGFAGTQYNKLKYSGLDKYVTRTIVSEEIGINKPDKRLFDYAISETGATPPYLYIGDNFETDILGALKAGWHTIWINHNDIACPMTDVEMKRQGIDTDLLVGNVKSLKEAYPLINLFIDQSKINR